MRQAAVPEIKHADGSIGADRGKQVPTTSCSSERNIMNLLEEQLAI